MQEIIVYIIGGLLAMYVAWSVYRLAQRRGSDPCCGCSLKSDCPKCKNKG